MISNFPIRTRAQKNLLYNLLNSQDTQRQGQLADSFPQPRAPLTNPWLPPSITSLGCPGKAEGVDIPNHAFPRLHPQEYNSMIVIKIMPLNFSYKEYKQQISPWFCFLGWVFFTALFVYYLLLTHSNYEVDTALPTWQIKRPVVRESPNSS